MNHSYIGPDKWYRHGALVESYAAFCIIRLCLLVWRNEHPFHMTFTTPQLLDTASVSKSTGRASIPVWLIAGRLR